MSMHGMPDIGPVMLSFLKTRQLKDWEFKTRSESRKRSQPVHGLAKKKRSQSGKHRALPVENVGILTWTKLNVYLTYSIIRNGHSPGTSVTKLPQCLPSHIFLAD